MARRMRVGLNARLGAGLALLWLAVATPALAQSSINLPKAGGATAILPIGEPVDIDAARADWEARPDDQRRTIQAGLVWSGDYTGAIDGTFGRMTFEAIRAFQARHKFAADGIPTEETLASLAKTAKEKQDAVGFAVVDDPITGVRLGLPTKLLGKGAKAEGGTRWVSKDGRIDYRAYAVPGQDLGALYEKLKAEGPGHKVGYAVLRADWFVIADTVGTKRGYQRFERVGTGVRGFLVYSDPAVGPGFDRVVIASAGSFVAEPGKAATAGAMPTSKPSVGTPQTPAVAPVVPPAAPTGLAATGLLVAPGRAVLVATAVDGCRSVAVSGKPATVAGLDDGKMLALLSWADTMSVAPLRLADAPAKPGDPVSVVATSPAGLTVSSGTANATGIVAALQRGGLSAPVLDASGHLLGLVASAPDESRRIAGVIPAASYGLVPGSALSAFVGRAGGGIETAGPSETLTSAGAVAALGARLVPVICEK